MYLTLGAASKECGKAKSTLLSAIKKGRLSANKNEKGEYEIDPAELFRCYPKNTGERTTDAVHRTRSNGAANTQVNTGAGGSVSFDMVLVERDKLLKEKEKTIERLQQDKEDIRNDLEDQKEQSRKITLLLEDHNKANQGATEWQDPLRSLEARLTMQEQEMQAQKERGVKLMKENRALRQALQSERNKTFWRRIFNRS